jgi:hypothetical protein
MGDAGWSNHPYLEDKELLMMVVVPSTVNTHEGAYLLILASIAHQQLIS